MISASTPSYVGSHVTGFASMVKSMAEMAEPTGKKNGKVNIIPGWVEPADMEETQAHRQPDRHQVSYFFRTPPGY